MGRLLWQHLLFALGLIASKMSLKRLGLDLVYNVIKAAIGESYQHNLSMCHKLCG